MNSKITWFFIFLVALGCTMNGYCDEMDKLSGSLETKFESLKPKPGSSVNSDYKLEQIALGTLYTAKAIDLLYRQNQEAGEKYREMAEKIDQLIKQNKEIIRLLAIIAKKSDEKKTIDKNAQ